MGEIPDYQTLMLPVLRLAAEGDTTAASAIERIGHEFSLTPDQMAQMLPSGKQALIANRFHWANTYLQKAGLIERPRRGVYRITERGRELLGRNPDRVDNRDLAKYPEFQKFLSRKGSGASVAVGSSLIEAAHATESQEAAVKGGLSPDERIAASIMELESALRDDVLDRIFEIEPISARARFFEKLVIKLLVAMGYGGGEDASAFHLGGRGDEGVDGVIHQDKLGLDPVYIQAKCYDRDTVISPEKIQAFKGALDDKGATRGVFLTTGRFGEAAEKSGRRSQKQIALIDGLELARLMVRFDVGVRVAQTVSIKKLDEDFFEE
ncbi:restriction system protein [Rhizobiales bacterium GAS191]|nr:restriction system protein [Rhizobiales bacterium GAS191]